MVKLLKMFVASLFSMLMADAHASNGLLECAKVVEAKLRLDCFDNLSGRIPNSSSGVGQDPARSSMKWFRDPEKTTKAFTTSSANVTLRSRKLGKVFYLAETPPSALVVIEKGDLIHVNGSDVVWRVEDDYESAFKLNDSSIGIEVGVFGSYYLMLNKRSIAIKVSRVLE
jgi:hypothetical protein